MPLKKQGNAGFTLVELLVTLTILGIVSAIAVPSFQAMVASNRMTNQVNTLSGLIAYARSAASTAPGSTVTICSSSNETSCSGNSKWENGWIVFRDEDGDGSVDAGDGDEVLRVHAELAGGNTLRVTGFDGTGKRIQFEDNGMPSASSGSAGAGTLTVCNDDGVSGARAIVVAASGQTRLVKNGQDHDGNAITCP
ncbi:GspH/FimT family pseudopilin [Halomonadaceae bacterium KBTZ08]